MCGCGREPARGILGADGEDEAAGAGIVGLVGRGGQQTVMQGRHVVPGGRRAALDGLGMADAVTREVRIGRWGPAEPPGAVAQRIDQEVRDVVRRHQLALDGVVDGERRAGGRGLGAGDGGDGEGAQGRHAPGGLGRAVREPGDGTDAAAVEGGADDAARQSPATVRLTAISTA